MSPRSASGLLLAMIAALFATIAHGALAQERAEVAAVPKFDFADAAAKYTLRKRGEDKPCEPYQVDVLKWTNPIRGTAAGSVFLWTQGGVPQAACCMYAYRNGQMGYAVDHELVSLSTEPIEARYEGQPVWETQKEGITWVAVAGAPQPAASRPARLAQMRKLAESFSGYLGTPMEKRQQLRLLTQPIYRFPVDAENDGGVFAFVETTDPEILLLLRANMQAKEPVWEFAAARMTIVHCLLTIGDKTVWALPWWTKGPLRTYSTRANVPWTAAEK